MVKAEPMEINPAEAGILFTPEPRHEAKPSVGGHSLGQVIPHSLEGHSST